MSDDLPRRRPGAHLHADANTDSGADTDAAAGHGGARDDEARVGPAGLAALAQVLAGESGSPDGEGYMRACEAAVEFAFNGDEFDKRAVVGALDLVQLRARAEVIRQSWGAYLNVDVTASADYADGGDSESGGGQ